LEQWDALVRVALALLVLIPLVYLVTRLYGRRLSMGRTGRALRLVDTVVLGPNRAVYVVEAVDRSWCWAQRPSTSPCLPR